MGVQSGFYDLDLALRENEFKSRSYLRIDKGGLIGGKVYVLAGRPGMGKTTLLLNILENTSVRGTRLAHCSAGLFSLEMSKRQIIDRLISIGSGIDIKKIICCMTIPHMRYCSLPKINLRIPKNKGYTGVRHMSICNFEMVSHASM